MKAFKKVDQGGAIDVSKKGFIWVLEPTAITNGVESTTRYRRTIPIKRAGRTEPAATQRQRSGAKGGKATKKATRLKRSTKLGENNESPMFPKIPDDSKCLFQFQNRDPSMGVEDSDKANMPYYMYTPLSLNMLSTTVHPSHSETRSYTHEDITGCTNGVDDKLFDYRDCGSSTDPTLLGSSVYDPTEELLSCDFN